MINTRKLGGGLRRRLWVMASMILFFLSGVAGLKIEEVQVPSSVLAGDNVILSCHFDLEQDRLYSLTWWRGQHQFYQYSPSAGKQKSKYDTGGIQVDERRSDVNTVVLTNVSLETAGGYKCEVVAEGPSFEKDSKLKEMKVIDIPDRTPVLSTAGRTQYSPGELLVANCTSPGARPAPVLHWSINGKEISSVYSRIISEGGKGRLLSPTSQLSYSLNALHFKDGQIRLMCEASIDDVYHQTSEVTLYRPMAPSQKLYDAGSALEVSWYMTWILSVSLVLLKGQW